MNNIKNHDSNDSKYNIFIGVCVYCVLVHSVRMSFAIEKVRKITIKNKNSPRALINSNAHREMANV